MSVSSTSRSLLARARDNEPAAWDRVVDLYEPLLLYWCRRWNVPEDETADIVQEVFRAVTGHIGEFQKRGAADTFRGWLRTIARNKVHDHIHRRRGPRAVGGTEVQHRLAEVPMPRGDDDGGEEGAHQKLIQRALGQIRGHFEDRTWRAFEGVVIDGRETADVAREFGMTPGAVRVAKSRVLQRLRAELGELIE